MLHLKMDNGATVADWLGTASIAAAGAATILTRARSGADTLFCLQTALERLEQATAEVEAIRARVGREQAS